MNAHVYDLSKFGRVHPGGLSVLLDQEVAGQDATDIFYSLHRREVLERPQYAKLHIGMVQGEQSSSVTSERGALSQVPYGEPTWLTPGYYSPYHNDVRHPG